METNSLEVARPLHSDERIPEAKLATSGHSSASEYVQPFRVIAKEIYAAKSVSNSRFMSFEVDDGGDFTNPIRTGLFADFGNLKGEKITHNSNSTFWRFLKIYACMQVWGRRFDLPG
jgi:hypothetical protein